jgi:hypothetical protein
MVAVGIHLRAQRVQEEGEEVVGHPNDLRAISRSLAGAVVLEEGESEHRGWVYVWGGMVMAAWQKHLLPPPCGLVLMLHSVPRARH